MEHYFCCRWCVILYSKLVAGIYHKTQIGLTYNSNHMEGNQLAYDRTRSILETNTIRVRNKLLNVDDVIETANRFCCIDMIIDSAKARIDREVC